MDDLVARACAVLLFLLFLAAVLLVIDRFPFGGLPW